MSAMILKLCCQNGHQRRDDNTLHTKPEAALDLKTVSFFRSGPVTGDVITLLSYRA